MNTENTITRLTELPQEIADIQLDILQKTQDATSLSNEKIRLETKMKVEIASLVDDNGKKLHSNDDARKAAFNEMAEDDPELNDLNERISQLEKNIQERRIDFDCLNNEQRNLRSILYFLSGTKE